MSARISSRSADLDRSASPEYLTVERPFRTVQQWLAAMPFHSVYTSACVLLRAAARARPSATQWTANLTALCFNTL